MAPALQSHTIAKLARRTAVTAAPALASHHFERRGLSVNHTQGVTLGVICAYVVIIALLWNFPYVRWVLWPFKVSTGDSLMDERELTGRVKMLVIAFHEFGHAIMAVCTGGRVESISLDPHEGGKIVRTMVMGDVGTDEV